MTEQRARRGLFTVSIIGTDGEHKLQGITGLERTIETIDGKSESTRLGKFDLPAQLNTGAITFTEAPFAGCGDMPAGNFYFEVELDSTPVAHVRSVSGLGIDWAIMENRESTLLNVQKLWDKYTVPEITIQQVIELSEGDQLFDAIEKLGRIQGPGNAFSVVDGATCAYRGNWTIRLKNRGGDVIAQWTIYGAWPSRYVPINDYDADGGDVGLRSLTLRTAPVAAQPPIMESVSSWATAAGSGLVSPTWLTWCSSIFTQAPTRKNLTINHYHPDALPGVSEPLKRFTLFNCWPSQLTYSDLDAGSPDLATREVVMACDAFIPE